MKTSNKTILYWAAAIVVITFIAYFPAISNGFLNWDDDWYIIENPLIRKLSLTNIINIFSNYYHGQYSPLVIISMALNYNIAGLEPWTYHLSSILLHIINSLLVFRLFYLLFEGYKDELRIEIAGLLALLFGVHTFYMESVVWVSAQKIVMFTLFYLVSIICYIKYAKQGKKKFYFYSLLFFILSFASKEQAFSLAVTLPFVDFLLNRNLLNRKVILEKLVFIAFAVIFGIISIYAARSENYINENYSFMFYKQLFFACYGFALYILKLLIPFNLSAIHPYPENFTGTLPPFEYWICLFVVIMLIAVFIYSLKKSRYIAFAIAFFAINIFPVIQLFPFRNFIMADRYAYLPSIGYFFILGVAYKKLFTQKSVMPNILRVCFVLYIIFFLFYTNNRCKIWGDGMSLWNDVLKKYPNSVGAYNNRGNVKLDAGNISGAIADFNKALDINPNSIEAYNNRGNAKQTAGDFQGSISDFDKSIELDNDNAEAYSNRGISKAMARDIQGAVADFNKAIELSPSFVKAYINRGNAKTNMSDFEGAIADFNKAIEIDPVLPEAYYNRGLTKYSFNSTNDAINDFTISIQLKPDYAIAYFSRGMANIQRKNIEEGCRDLHKAYSLGYAPASDEIQKYCNN